MLPGAAGGESGRQFMAGEVFHQQIRPAALGRKNRLFIGDEKAGWRSAVIDTILAGCKSCGTDPYAYLKDVLERLPHMTNRQSCQITLSAWAKARAVKIASQTS